MQMIEQIVRFMKANQVARMTYNGIHIEMAYNAFDNPVVQNHESDLTALILDPLNHPAQEEELKFWSAGGAGILDNEGNIVPPPMVGENG